MRTRELIRSDLDAARKHAGRVGPMLLPNFLAAVGYRLSHAASNRRLGPLARLLVAANQVVTGAEIGAAAKIGPGLLLVHTAGVVVGPGVTTGSGLTLYGTTVLGSLRRQESDGWPVLGDGVTLYAKASVLGPVSVGDGAVIAAHALCLVDVPERHTALGVPAAVRPGVTAY